MGIFHCGKNTNLGGIKMEKVSRKNGLRIPRQIKFDTNEINSLDDEVEIKQGLATAENKKFKKAKVAESLQRKDLEWEKVERIPESANDLIVITKIKKLSAYVIAVTEKSPAKHRGVFVNRMQNYCLDAMEELLLANFIRIDSLENKKQREFHQKEAVIKLKMLGYIAMVALNSKCILKKQYKQIALQIGTTINLITAWKKSDDKRWRNRSK